jgi:ankyrin repeat protein
MLLYAACFHTFMHYQRSLSDVIILQAISDVADERECSEYLDSSQHLLHMGPQAAKARGRFSMMGKQLFNAASDGNTTTVKTLLSTIASTQGRQSSINYQNENGYSPLHKAADKGHTLVTQQLIAAHCNIDLQTGCSGEDEKNGGATPLLIAAQHGHGGIAKQLIAARCNVDLQDDYGYSVPA